MGNAEYMGVLDMNIGDYTAMQRRLSGENERTKYKSTKADINVLFDKSVELKFAHIEFENFITTVSEDLFTKIECLKTMKKNEMITWKDKSYASVQLFMLHQYLNRINRFQDVSRNSLDNIRKNMN